MLPWKRMPFIPNYNAGGGLFMKQLLRIFLLLTAVFAVFALVAQQTHHVDYVDLSENL